MALSKIVKINDKLSWALWKIDTDWQMMLHERDLPPGELHALESISRPQKKAEYLANRLALFALLDAEGIRSNVIIKDAHGKPHLQDADVHISIANSYPYAVAILSHEQPTGIDIEPPSDKLIRVQHKFLHDNELKTFQNDREKLCIAWCAKESLYKLHGRKNLSFKQHIRVEEVHYPFNLKLTAGIYFQDYSSIHRLYLDRIENYFIIFGV